MTKDNILLHIDFKTIDCTSKIESLVLKIILATTISATLLSLICSLFLNNVSHLPVIIVLLALAFVLPCVFKDVFRDDMAWPKYVSNVVQTVEPIDVCIEYGFKNRSNTSSDFQDGGALYFIAVSGIRSYSDVYKIEFPTKSVLAYASKFPSSLDFGRINAIRKNPLKAKAYIDPVSDTVVMIELDQLRFWVSKME